MLCTLPYCSCHNSAIKFPATPVQSSALRALSPICPNIPPIPRPSSCIYLAACVTCLDQVVPGLSGLMNSKPWVNRAHTRRPVTRPRTDPSCVVQFAASTDFILFTFALLACGRCRLYTRFDRQSSAVPLSPLSALHSRPWPHSTCLICFR